MNYEPNEDFQRQLELLIDDELGEKERGELLEFLDSEPDGWRRCALGFLEEQSFQSALGPERIEDLTSAPSPRRSVGGRGGWGLLAACAAALIAFASGYLLRGGGESARRPEAAAANAAAAGVVPALFEGHGRAAVFEMDLSDGMRMYRTHRHVPEFVVEALVEAGHRVQLVDSTLQLEAGDGTEIDLPVRETYIFETTPLSL